MVVADRLERLTDLVLFLLDARPGHSLDEIAHEVPGYPSAHEARRQAFERDKRLLRDEGIPVETVEHSGPQQAAYRIESAAFYLPDLHLEPDEQAALHLAVAGVHLGDPSGRDALLKLGAMGIGDAGPIAALDPPLALVPLFDALRRHAAVTFSYRGRPRRVAPAGLWFRGGHWYLVGWDTDRDAARTFRVDRVDGAPVAGETATGDLPDGFDPGRAVPDEPWKVGDGSEEEVHVLVDALEARRVVEEVGAGAVVDRRRDGSVVIRLSVTNEDALRTWVLALLDHAEVLGGDGARSGIVSWLEALAATTATTGTEAGTDSVGAAARRRAVSGSDDAGAERRVDEPVPARADRRRPPSASTRTRDAPERLRRLLAVVGWLARSGRAPIAEIAERFSISERELVHELELAACCGVPPYTPDTLMEIVVDGDSVEATLSADLSRPRRLTAAEGFALSTAARTILAVPGADADGALARALSKLDAVLGASDRLVVDLDEPPLLELVRRAADAGYGLRIEYLSGSSDELSERRVDPVAVVSIDGHWYLDGFCHRAGGMRRFRVDRIRKARTEHGDEAGGGRTAAGRASAARVTEEPQRGALGAEAFLPAPDARVARLRIGTRAAWVVESVPVFDVEARSDGGWEVSVAVGGRAWLERLLLQAGPHATVIDPPELATVGADAARRLLEMYREVPRFP